MTILPLDGAAPPQESARTAQGSAGPQVRRPDPPSAYALIYQRDIRSPLVETNAPTPAPTPPPKLNVTLMGTAVDPGYTCGMFRMPNGETRTVQVGGKIDEAEVVEIKEGMAVVKFAGQTLTLTVDKKEGQP